MKAIDLIKELEEKLKKDFGERCKDFCYACAVCGAYLAIDILKDLYNTKPIHRHKIKNIKRNKRENES